MTDQQPEVQLKNLVRASDLLKEFEENYLRKMFASADSLWDKYHGNFPTHELQSRYNEIKEKSLFLKEFYDAIKMSISYTAVTADNVNKLAKGVSDLRIMKDGKVRERLFAEQIEFLSTVFDKFEKINASYLED